MLQEEDEVNTAVIAIDNILTSLPTSSSHKSTPEPEAEAEGEDKGSDNGKSALTKALRKEQKAKKGERREDEVAREESVDSDDSQEPAFEAGAVGSARLRGKAGKGRSRRRHRGKSAGAAATLSKLGASLYLDVKDCLRTGGLEDFCPSPETPRECYDLVATRQGRTRMLRPFFVYLRAFRVVLFSRAVWRSTAPLILLSLLSAFICECTAHAPRYNAVTVLVLVAAVEFPHFPSKSVRPQITIAVIFGLSGALDVFFLLTNPALPALLKLLVFGTLLGKCAALFNYLTKARYTLRARKYLIRRLRLFGLPMAEPRRLGRDIRGRFLALLLIHLICAVLYLTFFLVLLTSMAYSDIFITGYATGVSLPNFALVKSISSAVLFLGLLLDTDPILALAHFGCLGWCMKVVKDYTRSKRLDLGGWPYAFFYNETRYLLFTWCKGIDFAWGLVGWINLGDTFGVHFYNMEAAVQALVALLIVTLILSDIWTPLLMVGLNWLLTRRKALQERGVLSDSDDSELDELNIREARAVLPRAKKRETSRERRKRLKLVREAKDESAATGPLALLVAQTDKHKSERSRQASRKSKAKRRGDSSDSSDSSSSQESENSVEESESDSESEESEESDGSIFDVTENPLAAASQFSSSRNSTSRRLDPSSVPAHLQGSNEYVHDDGVLDSYTDETGPNEGEIEEGAGFYLKTVNEGTGGERKRAEGKDDIDICNNTLRLCYRLHAPLGPEPLWLCDGQALTLSPSLTILSGSGTGRHGALILDARCAIEPSVYSNLWELLHEDSSFTADVAPLPSGEAVTPAALCGHLTRMGFFVVASGEGGERQGGAKVYACAAGWSRDKDDEVANCKINDDDDSGESDAEDGEMWSGRAPPCLCLLEFALSSAHDSDDGGASSWRLRVSLRCTQSRRAAAFVPLLSLGTLFDLL